MRPDQVTVGRGFIDDDVLIAQDNIEHGRYVASHRGHGHRRLPAARYPPGAGDDDVSGLHDLVGAADRHVRRHQLVHSTYHVPASNTAAALALFDNRQSGT